MEFYPAIKKNDVLIHATTWMNLENITLSERNQTQKSTYCMIQFKCNYRQIHGDVNLQLNGCQGLRRGGNRE